MYSIHGLTTVFDVMAYTVKAMKETGYMPGEIEDYIADAVQDNCSLSLIEVSKDRLKECNSLISKSDMSSQWYEDTWRDHSYLWEDDSEDTYDYLNKSNHNTWNNVFSDLESDDEEAYEGFSSCKKYTWNPEDEEDNTVYDPFTCCEHLWNS